MPKWPSCVACDDLWAWPLGIKGHASPNATHPLPLTSFPQRTLFYALVSPLPPPPLPNMPFPDVLPSTYQTRTRRPSYIPLGDGCDYANTVGFGGLVPLLPRLSPLSVL